MYVSIDAILTLAANATRPETSWPGIAVAVGAIVVMPLHARAKGHVAARLGSAATAGDAAQSWLCAVGAAAVLASTLASAAFGWWWLDPIAGLAIAGLAVREGREAWAGELCRDCAPVGFQPPTRCSENGGSQINRDLTATPRSVAADECKRC